MIEKKIKIGISGAHSTGKTTFIKNLTIQLQAKSISFKVVTDLAINCPLPILHNHTVESSLWIASKGITEEIEAEYKVSVVIVDRPVMDSWAYFQAACKSKYLDNNPKLITFKNIIDNWSSTYDIIYQTVIDNSIKIENNKNRDLNPEYRNQIGEEIITASKLFKIKPRELTSNNASSELKYIIEFITNSLK